MPKFSQGGSAAKLRPFTRTQGGTSAPPVRGYGGQNRPAAQNMEGKRPKRVKTEPKARHVDGHTLKAMGGLPGEGYPLRRTAELEDYGPAHPMAVQFNEEALENCENSGLLKGSGAWIDTQGVAN